jgi:hypothetical protein
MPMDIRPPNSATTVADELKRVLDYDPLTASKLFGEFANAG